MEKKKTWLLLSIALFSIGLLAACTSTSTAVNGTVPSQTITVQGTASIPATPTIAKITIGVTSFNEDVTVAQSENAEKMAQVFQALEKLEIAKEKIKTISYDISQRFSYTETGTDIAGYDVTNLVEVTLEDLNLVSQVIDVTVFEGVNQVSSVLFSLSEEESLTIYQEALTQAVATAKTKAKTLASASGVKINKPLSITENFESMPLLRYGTYDSIAEKSGMGGTPITGGQLRVEASVTVVYGY